METKIIGCEGRKIQVSFSGRDFEGRPVISERMSRGALLQYNGREYITLSDYIDEHPDANTVLTEQRVKRGKFSVVYSSQVVDDEETVRFLLESYHGNISPSLERAIQRQMIYVEKEKERERKMEKNPSEYAQQCARWIGNRGSFVR